MVLSQPVLIIGNGKMARHWLHYLSSLSIRAVQWYRSGFEAKELQQLSSQCAMAFLLISDDALAEFLVENPWLRNMPVIHFSGCHNIDGVLDMHPLYTFGETLYPQESYRKIHFVSSSKPQDLTFISGRIPNPLHFIEKEEKAFYHALCVLGGNFTTILWKKCIEEMTGQLGLPGEAVKLYLEKIAQNAMLDTSKALTGPLARGDWKTIEANLKALSQDPFRAIYQAFIKVVTPS